MKTFGHSLIIFISIVSGLSLSRVSANDVLQYPEAPSHACSESPIAQAMFEKLDERALGIYEDLAQTGELHEITSGAAKVEASTQFKTKAITTIITLFGSFAPRIFSVLATEATGLGGMIVNRAFLNPHFLASILNLGSMYADTEINRDNVAVGEPNPLNIAEELQEISAELVDREREHEVRVRELHDWQAGFVSEWQKSRNALLSEARPRNRSQHARHRHLRGIGEVDDIPENRRYGYRDTDYILPRRGFFNNGAVEQADRQRIYFSNLYTAHETLLENYQSAQWRIIRACINQRVAENPQFAGLAEDIAPQGRARIAVTYTTTLPNTPDNWRPRYRGNDEQVFEVRLAKPQKSQFFVTSSILPRF